MWTNTALPRTLRPSNAARVAALAGIDADDETGEVREPLQRQFRQVEAVREAMKWGVEVRPGVRDHIDAADVELGAGRVHLPRRFAREEVAHERRGQPLVRHHPALDDVAHVDQHVFPSRASSQITGFIIGSGKRLNPSVPTERRQSRRHTECHNALTFCRAVSTPSGVSTPTQKLPKSGFFNGKWGEYANGPECHPPARE